MEDKLRYLKLIDEKILSSCPTSEIEREIDEMSDWETRINETLEKIKEFFKGNYSSPPHSSKSANGFDAVIPQGAGTSHGEISFPTTFPTRIRLNFRFSVAYIGKIQLSSNRFLSGLSFHQHHQGMKLPKITLQRFDRNVLKFHAFWQAFERAVHNNPAVSEINKLNYLFGLLDGTAYPAVDGLDLRAENYENAVQILKSWFGKRQ